MQRGIPETAEASRRNPRSALWRHCGSTRVNRNIRPIRRQIGGATFSAISKRAVPAIEPHEQMTRNPTRPRTPTTPSCGAPIATRRPAAGAGRPRRASRCRRARPRPTDWCGSTASTRCARRSTIRARKIRRMLVTRNALERLGDRRPRRPALQGRAGRAARDRQDHRQRRRASGRADRSRAAEAEARSTRSATRRWCWCSTR